MQHYFEIVVAGNFTTQDDLQLMVRPYCIESYLYRILYLQQDKYRCNKKKIFQGSKSVKTKVCTVSTHYKMPNYMPSSSLL